MPRIRPCSVFRSLIPVNEITLSPFANTSTSPFDLPTSFSLTRWLTVVHCPGAKLKEPRPTEAPYLALHSEPGRLHCFLLTEKVGR